MSNHVGSHWDFCDALLACGQSDRPGTACPAHSARAAEGDYDGGGDGVGGVSAARGATAAAHAHRPSQTRPRTSGISVLQG